MTLWLASTTALHSHHQHSSHTTCTTRTHCHATTRGHCHARHAGHRLCRVDRLRRFGRGGTRAQKWLRKWLIYRAQLAQLHAVIQRVTGADLHVRKLRADVVEKRRELQATSAMVDVGVQTAACESATRQR